MKRSDTKASLQQLCEKKYQKMGAHSEWSTVMKYFDFWPTKSHTDFSKSCFVGRNLSATSLCQQTLVQKMQISLFQIQRVSRLWF